MTNPMIEAVARAIAKEKGIEICSDAMYQFSTFGPLAQAAITAIEPMIRAQVEREIVEWLRGQGIIQTEIDGGWWDTSVGVKYGTEIIAAIEAGEYRK